MPEFRYYSIYMMIALPIVVGYILIKRSGLQTRHNYMLILRLASIALAGTMLFVGFSYYVIELTLFDSLLLLLVGSVTMYAYLAAQKAISKRQLQTISRAKENMEKERLDILQKVTYDHYLTALSGLIKQLIDKTLPLDGTLIIWKEEDRSYILEQSGIFEDFSLDQLNQGQLHEHIENVTIDGELYFAFPLLYRKALNGWMIVGHKSSGGKFTVQEVETLSLLADTVCEIFKTTEILQENQRRYVYLPSLRYEDYQNVYVTRSTEKIRKEIALYLHDDILQSILAVRHMCEAISGVDPEIRALIIDTLDELNGSIRDKMFDVYPTTLQDLGLYQSLSILCRKLQEEAVGQPDLKIRLDAEIDLEVEEELEYTVFRTVKELLQNAVKHAEANQIVVSLEISEEGVLLGDIIDDGKGFDIERQLSAPVEGNHVGLLSVKQEMNALGGELTIRHNADAGMHIHFKIPLERMGE
ncbi:sensor histidine kinase [Saccharibacillus sacchari]|uniref:ATP-binding protein n=1 Tax=Saccharibacillus sacchari TaxID=456493 RepID=A0ACC6P991_9BACL